MASSDYVNYSIRPNKTVERRVIFEMLSTIAPAYEFEKFRYLGLGSMWFVDFVMAHKVLSITDMISIEKDEFGASRARFNRPFKCVEVKEGDSTIVLRGLDLERKPLVAWMDYDTSLNGPVLDDLSILSERAPVRSILIATINAEKGSLPTKDARDATFATEEDRLRSVAGDLVPQTLPKGAMQASNYPSYLSELLFDHIKRSVRKAGRAGAVVQPLFNLRYKDNAQMITIGAAIADAALSKATAELAAAKKIGQYLKVEAQLEIGVPPLTFKEKASLDQLMPTDEVPTGPQVEALGFRLKPSQIESYHSFYRHYPAFGEVSI